MGPAAAHHHYPVICMLLAAIPSSFVVFNTQKVFTGLEAAFRGMADAFAGVVMLLVAAGVFAGAEHHRLYSEPDLYRHQLFGSASIILMLVLVVLTMLAAMTTGSGNAPFYAFVEMILSWHTPPASTRLTCPFNASGLQPGSYHFSGIGRGVCGLRDGENLRLKW